MSLDRKDTKHIISHVFNIVAKSRENFVATKEQMEPLNPIIALSPLTPDQVNSVFYKLQLPPSDLSKSERELRVKWLTFLKDLTIQSFADPTVQISLNSMLGANTKDTKDFVIRILDLLIKESSPDYTLLYVGLGLGIPLAAYLGYRFYKKRGSINYNYRR